MGWCRIRKGEAVQAKLTVCTRCGGVEHRWKYLKKVQSGWKKRYCYIRVGCRSEREVSLEGRLAKGCVPCLWGAFRIVVWSENWREGT